MTGFQTQFKQLAAFGVLCAVALTAQASLVSACHREAPGQIRGFAENLLPRLLVQCGVGEWWAKLTFQLKMCC